MKLPDAREVVAFAIVGLFAWSLIQNPHEPLIVGAMIAAFSTAYGFYLGGSKVGSDTAIKNADTVSEAARITSPAPESVQEAAQDTANAAQDRADEIRGEPA